MTSAQADQRRGAALAGPCQPGQARWLTGTCRCFLLAPVPAATKSARDFTAAVLHEWRLDVLNQDAVMIASELAANAIRYGAAAGELVEFSWYHQPGEVTCVVTDASSEPPVQALPDLAAESGRGLQIVDTLAAAWGWLMVGPHRKAVWAALRIPAALLSAPVCYPECLMCRPVIRVGMIRRYCSRWPPAHEVTPACSTTARSSWEVTWWTGPWISTLQPS